MPKNVFELTDKELEDCIDGSANLTIIREILKKPNVVSEEGYVSMEDFGQWFAYALEGTIGVEEDTDEWEEANDTNWLWGETIAGNINDYIDEE